MPHVLLLGPMPPYRGGIAHFGVGMARALRERGHRVSAVSFARQYPEWLFPGRTQFEPSPIPPDTPDAPRLLDSVNPASWLKTARLVRRMAPDAVVFQHWMPFFGPAYGTVARRLGPPPLRPRRIALVHNALPHERRPGDVALTRYFLSAMDGALVLSDAVRRDVERLAPRLPIREAVHPVYDQYGAAEDRLAARAALGLPPDAPVLLFFGFVRRYKGLDVLLEALPRLREALPDVRLVVAGECYDDEAAYRAQSDRLGVTEAVTFALHYHDDAAVRRAFGAADVVVQPYRTATQSGVAQTAFGFGVPVVTTDVGGLAEAVGEGGLVVQPESPDALADALRRFFTEDGVAESLRSGAAAQGSRSEWGALAKTLEALFLPPS